MDEDRQVDDLGSYFQFPIGLATVVQTLLQTLAYRLGFRAEEAGITCALRDMLASSCDHECYKSHDEYERSVDL
jgi:hypothetical protein